MAVCPACDYQACKECLKKYILGVGDDGACMQCKKIMPRSVLADTLGLTFVNGEYKRHRERVLFDRERAMLEETVPYMEREIDIRESTRRLDDMRSRRMQLLSQLRQLESEINIASQEMHRLTNLQTRGTVPIVTATEARREFVHACPRDGCDGFVSSAWKCRACHHHICKDCNVDKGEQTDDDHPHVCNPQDVESLQLIRGDSKPCPKCGVPIHKLSGCSQMYCTICTCVWCWRTGRIDATGVVHNPHALQARRAVGMQIHRDQADIPCGGMPNEREIFDAIVEYCKHVGEPYVEDYDATGHHNFDRYRRNNVAHYIRNPLLVIPKYACFRSLAVRMTRILAMVMHVQHYEIRHLEENVQADREPENAAGKNRDLRIKYLLGEATRETVGRKVHEREKKILKEAEIVLVLRTLVQVSEDLMRQIVVDPLQMMQLLSQCDQLADYCNVSLCKLAYLFTCTVPVLMGAGSHVPHITDIGHPEYYIFVNRKRWTRACTPTIHQIFADPKTTP